MRHVLFISIMALVLVFSVDLSAFQDLGPPASLPAALTATPAAGATVVTGLSPMTIALIVGSVLAVVFTGLVQGLKSRMAAPGKRKVRLWALAISAMGATVTGAIMAVAVGVPWQAAVIAAGGPFGSVIVHAVTSLIIGEEPPTGGAK